MADTPTPQEKPAPILIVPPSIARLRSPVGLHRRGMKVLVYGESKSGKSTTLASFPNPILAIDSGEGGIGLYLDSAKGDECFEATNPEAFLNLCEFALKHENHFKTLVIDPVTTTWEDWMDYWSEKFGGDIKGPQWNQVKGPWKVLAKQLNRSKLNVGQAAWLKDLVWERPESQPGVQGQLQIRAVEVPQVERKTVYHVDILLQTSIVRDAKNRPTNKHRITLAGGRRPRTVDPSHFHVGKTWDFDSKKPTSPWDTIIAPIAAQWDDGAVDYLGMDAREAGAESVELEKATQDYTVGCMLRVIAEQTNFQVYRDRVWPNEIAPIIDELDAEHKAIVMKAHEEAKVRLQKGV